MATLWVICGAGRGVGKTHLAEALCRVLPRSVHVKCGHGPRQEGKSPHLLRSRAELTAFVETHDCSCDHFIIESNAFALEGGGDVVIYLAGPPVGARVRTDAARLRACAHLVVDGEPRPAVWRESLAGRLPQEALQDAVVGLLCDQARYLRQRRLVVRSKIWFETEQGHVFGPGLFRLLAGVRRYGTLHGSAQAAGMSYRYAWNQIRKAERRLGQQLIVAERGGRGGGGSRLTPAGSRLLRLFESVNREVAEYADARFAHHFAEVGEL